MRCWKRTYWRLGLLLLLYVNEADNLLSDILMIKCSQLDCAGLGKDVLQQTHCH